MSLRKTERGGMDIGSIIQLALLLAAIFAAWNLTPVYLKDFQLSDAAQQAAQAFPRTADGDAACKERIWRKVQDLGLDEFLAKEDLHVEIAGANRRVEYHYERVVTVLPGWKRTFTLGDEINQPLL